MNAASILQVEDCVGVSRKNANHVDRLIEFLGCRKGKVSGGEMHANGVQGRAVHNLDVEIVSQNRHHGGRLYDVERHHQGSTLLQPTTQPLTPGRIVRKTVPGEDDNIDAVVCLRYGREEPFIDIDDGLR